MNKRVEVVAAVIFHEGRVFSTQRGYGDWRGYWEFPGGKIEIGETPKVALQREILEELDTEIGVDGFIKTIEWDYPTFHLLMHCYWCHVKNGGLTLKEHKAAKWLGKDDLFSVKWLPADMQIFDMILKRLL